MEKLATVPAALDSLEVTTTATGPVDPAYHIYREWCDGTVKQRSAMLTKQRDLTGIMYWNQAVSYTHLTLPTKDGV